MGRFKFTVIVPTRERVETLKWTLQTLTSQDYDNLEIIVSDNFSNDGTEEYVATISDPRIRYVNTGRRVSMAENYEFGLSYATGDYVCFIGDDDGLVLGALNTCNELLNKHQVEAIGWVKAEYIWNGYRAPYLTNTLDIPVSKEIKVLNTFEEMSEILMFRKHLDSQIPVYFLPCIYNGFIHRGVFDRIKAAQDGKFFHSRYPDIYSTMAFPYFIEKYVYSHKPLTVNGVSSRGNGTGSILLTLKKKMPEAEKFEKESTIPIHPRIRFSDFASLPFITMEAYLQVCDNLKIEPVFFDMQRLADEAIRYARAYTPQTLPYTIQSIKDTCKVNNVTCKIDEQVKNVPATEKIKGGIKNNILKLIRASKKLYVTYLRTVRKKNINIIPASYPQNILGACQFAGEQLGYVNRGDVKNDQVKYVNEKPIPQQS